MTETNSALTELRTRRLAKEAAAREEQENALAKYRAQARENRLDLFAKIEQIDRMFEEVRQKLDVLEKSQSAFDVALSDLSPAERPKLLQS